MREGWLGKHYVVLFPEGRIEELTSAYELNEGLPDFEVIGLLGWDDLIVRKVDGSLWHVPSIPADPQYLEPLDLNLEGELQTDERFTSKIKWYVTPIIFGGSPKTDENGTWISLANHCQAVAFWNRTYRDAMKQKS
jgi:hypothetical protein